MTEPTIARCVDQPDHWQSIGSLLKRVIVMLAIDGRMDRGEAERLIADLELQGE